MNFSGNRTGALSGLSATCGNQDGTVKADGTLAGRRYDVTIPDPSHFLSNGKNDYAIVFEYPVDPNGTVSAWDTVSATGTITNWNLNRGATFDLQLVPDSSYGSESTGPLNVTGTISCS